MSETDTTEKSEYAVNFWVEAECFMDVEAASEEDAIEQAKKAIDEHMHYGMVDPVGDGSHFQAREK